MFIDLPGIAGNRSSGSYPPAGTLLSAVCSGPAAHDQGNGDYYDVNGTLFVGMFTLWEQFADGVGGSYWSNLGDNAQSGQTPPTSCWLPQYFYFSNGVDPVGFYWEACGSSGTFNYGQNSYYGYYNGDGTSTTDSQFSSYGYSSGYQIYDSGCCQVYYDGNTGYYYSDNCGGGCPGSGSYSYSACVATAGNDAKGDYWSGAWVYADFYTDGFCGYYQTNEQGNTNGCFYPNGYWTSYSYDTNNSLTWYVYDSASVYVADGTFNYSWSAHGDRQNGAGSQGIEYESWTATDGQTIASGTFMDSGDFNTYYYSVTFDLSNSSYIVNITPV